MVSEMGVVEVGNLIQISMIYIIGLIPNKFLFFWFLGQLNGSYEDLTHKS